jgi:DNA-binding LytR/AlgR family response regulator
MIRAVLIEDEEFAQKELLRLLQGHHQEISVIKCIETVEESITFFKENDDYDLIFSDIHLADGLSFDIYKEVQIAKPIIFTTAYDKYAIKAFSVFSIDYLLKPIMPEMLADAILKYKSLHSATVNSNWNIIDFEEIKNYLKSNKQAFKTRFLSRKADKLISIQIEDIAWFYVENNSLFIYTFNKERYLIDGKLETIELQVNPEMFFRINRAMIVNYKAIEKTEKHFSSRYHLKLNPPFSEEVFVSKTRSSEFIKWLGQ